MSKWYFLYSIKHLKFTWLIHKVLVFLSSSIFVFRPQHHVSFLLIRHWVTGCLYKHCLHISSNSTVGIMKQYVPYVRMGLLHSFCLTHVCIHWKIHNVAKLIIMCIVNNWWICWVFNIILCNLSIHLFFILGYVAYLACKIIEYKSIKISKAQFIYLSTYLSICHLITI